MTVSRTGKPALLIVDDDPLIIDSLGFFLSRDFAIETAASRHECIERLRRLPAPPRLALIDLGLPPLPHQPDEGFALITDLLAHAPEMRIIVLSGQNDELHARHARTLGALDFIAKPANPEVLRDTLRQALSHPDAQDWEAPATDSPAAEAAADCGLIGQSEPMRKLREQIRQYADSPFPVLIEGESGSGKEIVASCGLHRFALRQDKPFFALNCAAISPSLVEPTLFGYAKGAFTGASQAKSGYFEDAGEGTLFLDEIGELPLDLQPKLLRVLENGEYQRVGETQKRLSRARIVAATNRDLRREVREGRFRADLYHRLSVFTISVPPLRELGDDKFLLLEHFRDFYAQQTGQAPFTLSEAARASWRAYPFPGNVRELRNIVIRLATKYPGTRVEAEPLQDELEHETALDETVAFAADDESMAAMARRELQQDGSFRLDATLRRWEQAYVQAALQLSHGNVSQAARLLGINRTTLYNRMDALERDA